MEKILENKVEYCKEQEDMILNNVIPVLEREDVYIDEQAIEDGLDMEKYLPFKLVEWEIFLFALIAGIKYKANNDIFYKVIRIMVGRGSGKNGFIDFLCLYFLSPKHGIRGYNIDILANSEKQCKVSFEDVYLFINEPDNPENAKALKSNFYTTKELIIGKRTKSELRFNTSSKRGKDSKRTGCIIYDEKHEYLSAENINTLKSGLGKTPYGREITITTDGHIRGAVLDKEKEQNHDILKEYNPNNRTLVFWCRIEKEEEWNDETKWIKAIPSIDDMPDLKNTIRQEIIDMPYNMDYYPEFMAKRMNFPVGNKDTEVALWEDIKATNQPLPNLKGMTCVGGLDYAKTNDFVACVLVFFDGKKYYVLQHTFVCTHSRDLPGMKAPLKEWEKAGDLEFVDDVEISPRLVANWFENMGRDYNIKKIAVDNFRYSLMSYELKKIGFSREKAINNLYLTRPSDGMRVSPIINSVFINHNFVWGDLPIMRWYTNNTKKSNNGINVAYEKIEPNYRKTDGFMALVAAMSIANELEKKESLPVPDLPDYIY